jgi:hypothetical protein
VNIISTLIASAIATAAIVSATALGAQGQLSKGSNVIRTDIDISGPFLQHLTKNPHDPESADRCGEPQIAQDVLHPNILVVSCMSSGGLNYQTPRPIMFWSYTNVTKGDQWHQPCYTFISRDGGDRWERVRPSPVTASALNRACLDPLAQQGPHGELYLGGDGHHYPVNRKFGPIIVQAGEIPLELLGIAFTRSLDGGRTWSEPILIPTANDRPFWTVDESTGVIYSISGCAAVTTIGEYGCTPDSRNLAVSTDQGRTWVPSVNIWNVKPPTPTLIPGRLHNIAFGGGGTFVAAAQGVFATAGTDRRFNKSMFKYSADDGVTFIGHPIPLSGSTGCNPRVSGLAADPARRGTFAIIVMCAPVSKAVLVFVTHDLGATWTKTGDLAVVPPPGYVTLPVNARSSPSYAKLSGLISIVPTPFDVNRPWVAYGPTGALGVLWRQNYGAATSPPRGPIQPGPQDVFVAISRDGGATFSKPIRVNTAASPAPDPRQRLGDDISNLILDGHYAYAVWGDWRSGELETWFRKVQIPAG